MQIQTILVARVRPAAKARPDVMSPNSASAVSRHKCACPLLKALASVGYVSPLPMLLLFNGSDVFPRTYATDADTPFACA